MAEVLLEHSVDINSRDIEGWTPLHAAAATGNIQMINLLIKSGSRLITINNDDKMPVDVGADGDIRYVIKQKMLEAGECVFFWLFLILFVIVCAFFVVVDHAESSTHLIAYEYLSLFSGLGVPHSCIISGTSSRPSDIHCGTCNLMYGMCKSHYPQPTVKFLSHTYGVGMKDQQVLM